jgi:hypothetical protein
MRPRYYIFAGARGSTEVKKLYFNTYKEAATFIRDHAPTGPAKGRYHIYPVDSSGYASKSEGRTSYGRGNKEWEKRQGKK